MAQCVQMMWTTQKSSSSNSEKHSQLLCSNPTDILNTLLHRENHRFFKSLLNRITAHLSQGRALREPILLGEPTEKNGDSWNSSFQLDLSNKPLVMREQPVILAASGWHFARLSG
jgi:hypothetical protein